MLGLLITTEFISTHYTTVDDNEIEYVVQKGNQRKHFSVQLKTKQNLPKYWNFACDIQLEVN